MTDNVNSPPHYKKGRFETIDKIEDTIQHYPPVIALLIGNAIKYLDRAPHKGNLVEDLKKGQWYLNRAIAKLAPNA